jgi:hydroxymethylpyrimidine/phosphomethylpyrimidine kinase
MSKGLNGMTAQTPDTPVVLSFAGHDPTGGAGLQADIEAFVSLGCHPTSVITTLTVQDTVDVKFVQPLEAGLVVQQARAVLEDLPVMAVKIGLLGSVEVVEAVHTVLTDYPRLPVVLDPVLASGGGTPMAEDEVTEALRALLLPQVTVLTPNGIEARRLAPEADSLDACAMALLECGADLVLITGGHEPTPDVVNRLYGNHRRLDTFSRARLPHDYHGSGCTLSSGIAALLAQGNEPRSAIHQAQEYAWNCLRHGRRLGMGQHLPNRLFWAADGTGS